MLAMFDQCCATSRSIIECTRLFVATKVSAGRVASRILVTAAATALLIAAGWQADRCTAAETPRDDYRWDGHDFVFCFVSDDGRNYNLGWAELAIESEFRFTIAINPGADYSALMTGCDVHELASQGFEIANHSYSHGRAGLPADCPLPPRGSLAGYFRCEVAPDTAMVYFKAEIERDSVVVFGDLPPGTVNTLAYPRHMYLHAIIDSLIAEGYSGARSGGAGSTHYWSDGEFTEYPCNGWEGGISLFRIPVAAYTAELFGDHSADPPVHFTREEFEVAVAPVIDQAQIDGGILTVYAHHFGDDDDTYGDVNYGAGGITPEELSWLVEIVRASNGVVMTLGEAVAYYRERTVSHQSYEGDWIWAPATTAVPALRESRLTLFPAVPNPCNPRTTFSFHITAARQVTVAVYDLRGRCVSRLADRLFTPGSHRLQWEARDDAGRRVPAGTYLFTATTGGVSLSRKVVLLR